jgi:hypothetical protein
MSVCPLPARPYFCLAQVIKAVSSNYPMWNRKMGNTEHGTHHIQSSQKKLVLATFLICIPISLLSAACWKIMCYCYSRGTTRRPGARSTKWERRENTQGMGVLEVVACFLQPHAASAGSSYSAHAPPILPMRDIMGELLDSLTRTRRVLVTY